MKSNSNKYKRDSEEDKVRKCYPESANQIIDMSIRSFLDNIDHD